MRAQAKTQNRKTVLRHGGALSLEAGSEGGRQHDTADYEQHCGVLEAVMSDCCGTFFW